MIDTSKYKEFHKHVGKHINKSIHKHIGKHVLRHTHKIVHHADGVNHIFLHLGELILISTIGCMSLIFAGNIDIGNQDSMLFNNKTFSYPLQKVSTLECRTLYWNDMPDSCKIDLPIIHGANYAAYQNNETYRSIYTTLRASPYSDSWNQKLGAHAGVDIATARGTPLYSVGDGEVYYAGWNSAYGNVVKIKYMYNGEIIYAVYAHMDTIGVKKGDTVTKGQSVGTVGNSGNTRGKLGGYHVHFEIDKDNYGRPAYSYTNCPDLKKGHYRIIQDGLCRRELFTYQYDPIKIFESHSTYVSQDVKDIDDTDSDIIDNVQTGVVLDTGSSNNIDLDILKDDDLQENIDKWKEIIEDNQEEIKEEMTKEEHHEVDGDKQENDIDSSHNSATGIIEDIQETDIKGDTNIDMITEEDKTILELSFDGINLLAKHFLTSRDIEMHSELLGRDLFVGETITLDIDIFQRSLDKKHNGFKGVLKEPFMFIATDDNIDIDISYLQLVTNGEAQVKIIGKKVGDSSLIIKFGDKKIGILDIKVK